MEFDSKKPILVYMDGSGFDSSLEAFEVRGGIPCGTDRSSIKPVDGPLQIDLSPYAAVERATGAIPPSDAKKAKGYLLRFAKRWKGPDFTLFELWMKLDYSSSGVRYFARVGKDGRIDWLYLNPPICDDWG